MSLKTELKLMVLHEQGIRADDRLEEATKRQAAHDGAKQVLRTCAKNAASLATLVDKDLDDGKIPIDEPLKVAAYVKLMIDRCVNGLLTAAQQQENLQIAVGGEIVAYQGMVASFKKELDSETAKLTAQTTPAVPPAEGERPANRALGTHPGSGIGAQRRAEEKPKKRGKANGHHA